MGGEAARELELANWSSLPRSVFRSFFPYFDDVRQIVRWHSRTTQPLDYLAVRHKWR